MKRLKELKGAKELVPVTIVAFVSSFMFFVYEPLLLYLTNMDDLWFDFSTMIGPVFGIFLILFGADLLLILSIFYIVRILPKGLTIFKWLSLLTFATFVMVYIQGNFLIDNLPGLNGTIIDWSTYRVDNITSIVISMLIFTSIIIYVKSATIDKALGGAIRVTLAIFAMLSVSLISTIATTEDPFRTKPQFYITNNDINNVSTERNLIILVMDTVDSREFHKVISQDSDFQSTFADFTYFPDTLSAYPFTRESMPFLLSGVWNENEYSFNKYYISALNKSPFLSGLEERGFDLHYYGEAISDEPRFKNFVSNVHNVGISLGALLYEESSYALFKYSPWYLKGYSGVEYLDFNNVRGISANQYLWGDETFYKETLQSDLTTDQERKNFQLFHIEGAHTPFYLDGELNQISPFEGTYDQKLEACYTIVKAFLARLRENKTVYDNSAIIITADHGFDAEYDNNYPEGRQNPILYIKGVGENHKFTTSDLSVSQADLQDAFLALADGKSAKQLFQDLDPRRKRRFILYTDYKENHMVEYEQTGKAWDMETLVPTGREFNR